MRKEDVTIYSGGHRGAEAAFGEAAEKWGVAEVTYSFAGHKVARSVNVQNLSDEELARGDISMELASRLMNRTYYEKKRIRKVLQLIFHMVNSGHQVFAVGNILPDNTVKGGTGWAVELARLFNRPVHVYDQEKLGWFTWQQGGWQADSPAIKYDTICASGTRNLSPEGRAAIDELFSAAFGN
ncbi:MAG: hypothetical protein ABFR97_04990 [Thermodesulfobacteriota bacterium]